MITKQIKNMLGWKEWLSLPDLGIQAVKVKIDTGASTSALHAFRLETFDRNDAEYVRFWFHPAQKRTDIELVCEAPIFDRRIVRDSGGHQEERIVIETHAKLGDLEWPVELTLTSREDMQFRMLLGRKAIIDGQFLVNASAAFLAGKKLSRVYNKYIKELS